MNLSDAAVTQVMIPVDDFERGVAFYRDALGIPLLFTAPPRMAFFKNGTVRLLVGAPSLAEFTDTDCNQLALMANVAVAAA